MALNQILRAVVTTMSLGIAAVLAACGGGGTSSASTAAASGSGATAGGTTALSSGTITAFGSVFVNGHEFSISHARLIDDDSGAALSPSSLEVGMVVDVKASIASTAASPDADELHLHPMARGYLDAADSTSGVLKVMGQTIQTTAATNVSDRRACVGASSNACQPASSISDLTANAGTSSSYVTVHGYLYASSTDNTNIVATLISVSDAPSSSAPANFKAEGVVTSASGSSLAIGGLAIDLSGTTCSADGAKVACAGAYSVGQVVSVASAAAPALPVASFSPSMARLASRVTSETAGAAIEIEGSVSSVATSSFTVRGISVDASGLASGSALPAVGDVVRVAGAVASDGLSISATSVVVLHAASSKAYGLEGDAGSVAPGTASGTYTLDLLGQSITVNSGTHLADRQSLRWFKMDPASNPFNIASFQSYLTASASHHVIVKAQADTSGNLVAQSLTIVPASSLAIVAGSVDATPAPANGSNGGTPTTFSVHGVAVSADPSAVLGTAFGRGTRSATVAAGDTVVVRGSYTAATLSVAGTPSFNNVVLDLGQLTRHDNCGF